MPVIECLRFPEPLAPAVAAERAGAVIDVEALLTDLTKAGDGFDRIVVEGAGGLLVPVWGDVTMADLAGALGRRPRGGHPADPWHPQPHGPDARGGLRPWPPRRRPGDLGLAGSTPSVTEQTNLERLSAMAPVLGLLPSYPDLDTADPATAPPELAFLTAD